MVHTVQRAMQRQPAQPQRQHDVERERAGRARGHRWHSGHDVDLVVLGLGQHEVEPREQRKRNRIAEEHGLRRMPRRDADQRREYRHPGQGGGTPAPLPGRHHRPADPVDVERHPGQFDRGQQPDPARAPAERIQAALRVGIGTRGAMMLVVQRPIGDEVHAEQRRAHRADGVVEAAMAQERTVNAHVLRLLATAQEQGLRQRQQHQQPRRVHPCDQRGIGDDAGQEQHAGHIGKPAVPDAAEPRNRSARGHSSAASGRVTRCTEASGKADHSGASVDRGTVPRSSTP